MTKPLGAQKLMFPLDVALDKNEIDAWTASKSLLSQLGFHFTIDSNGLKIESLPSCVAEKDSNICIENITKSLSGPERPDRGELAHELVSNLVYVVSQNFQVKSDHEIESFVNQLFSCEDHSFCPFGKPIMQTLTIEELTTKF